MDSVEDYAKQWAKCEKEDLDTLSDWMKSVRSLIQIRIKKLNGTYLLPFLHLYMFILHRITMFQFVPDQDMSVYVPHTIANIHLPYHHHIIYS